MYPSYQLILNNGGEITPLALIGFIGAYGPTIGALIIQRVVEKGKNKQLLKKLIRFKVNWRVYAFIILAPLILYAVAFVVPILVSEKPLEFDFLAGISGMPIWFLAALPFGPMGEELGWRGFMLPRLLEKHSILKSSVIVGLAWGLWHMASFTFPGAALPEFFEVSVATIGLYCLNTIALSMVFTYAHLRGKGSVLIAILLHAFFNAAANIVSELFPMQVDTSTEMTAYIVHIFLVGLIGWYLLKRFKA